MQHSHSVGEMVQNALLRHSVDPGEDNVKLVGDLVKQKRVFSHKIENIVVLFQHFHEPFELSPKLGSLSEYVSGRNVGQTPHILSFLPPAGVTLYEPTGHAVGPAQIVVLHTLQST